MTIEPTLLPAQEEDGMKCCKKADSACKRAASACKRQLLAKMDLGTAWHSQGHLTWSRLKPL